MQRVSKIFVLGCILIVTIGCYLPGLHSGFLFDDVINIQNNLYIRISQLDAQSLWQAAMSGSAGILRRPISMLTFALDYYWDGLDPYHFKAVNLAIHLLNGIGLFALMRLLLGLYQKLHCSQLDDSNLQWISLGVAAIWLLHPFNLTGVLYVVQRMASLSALFTFIGLAVYLFGRKRQIAGQKGGWFAILVAVFVFTPLAALSKENGLLLPAFMLAIELTLLQWQAPSVNTRRSLIALFAITVVLPVIVGLFYVLWHPGSVTGGYSIRDFSLVERLMTESRVLWFYLHMTVLPSMTAMGLYHDDIIISHGLLTPPTTLMSIIGLVALMASALVWRKRYPLVASGILFFLIGHSMESSVISLELVHEHRNYLPMFGLLLPAVYYLLAPTYHPSSLRLRRTGLVVLTVLFAGLTLLRASQWGEPLRMMQMEVQHHPDSARANSDLAFYYAYLPANSKEQAEENYRNAVLHFSQAAYLSERDTAGFFGVLAVNAERGLPTDVTWTDELEKRLEHFPFSPSSANSLMALEKCLVSGRCKHSPDLMDRLLQAALRNPTLTGPRRSTVLFAQSDFLFKTKHQVDAAVEVAYEAAAAAPTDIEQRLTLIVFLVNMGKLDEADVEIVKAYQMNERGSHNAALAQLEKQLMEVKRSSRGAK